MSVLSLNFDYNCSQCSPVQNDYLPKVDVDETGKEIVSYEKVDYHKIAESHGNVDFWSLGALVKAGINPRFNICTGFNTGLELDFAVSAAAAAIDSANVETSKD